jgi:hypothetical protein
VIGLSYYPKWHNTLADPGYNLDDLAKTYQKDIDRGGYFVPEGESMTCLQRGQRTGRGTWERRCTWEESIFDRQNHKANKLLSVMTEIRAKYMTDKTGKL